MISLPTVALLAILANPGQPAANPQPPVLLDFYADWCGPCRTMEPVVQRLAAEGYAVRKINIDQQRQLARQYRITAVPTFVVVSGDREVQRIVGPTSYEQLAGLLRPATSPVPVTCAVTQPPGTAAPGRVPAPSSRGGSPLDAAMQATVRLRVEDSGGNSLGTGTVIHAHGQHALVMTCGHIFRDSKGQGEIVAEVFTQGGPRTVAGRLLDYDLEHDTALVEIKTGVPVTAVPVAPPGYTVQAGDDVFSIGCDHGQDPSVRDSRITAVNKYELPDNFVVAGAPVIGRSGGGLFSRDGYLIGVCNLANKEDDEGIYAALTLLHHRLDHRELSWIYQPEDDSGAGSIAETRQPDPQPPAPGNGSPPEMSRSMPGSRSQDGLAGGSPRSPQPGGLQDQISADDEVYVILRSRSDPTAQPRVIYLRSLPRELRDQIARHARQDLQPASVVALPDGALPIPDREGSLAGRTLRGQTAR